MKSSCSKTEKILNDMLEQDEIREPSPELVKHAEICHECKSVIDRALRLNRSLADHFENIRSSAPSMVFNFPVKQSYIERGVDMIKKYLIPFSISCAVAVLMFVVVHFRNVSGSHPPASLSAAATLFPPNSALLVSGAVQLADGGHPKPGEYFSFDRNPISCDKIARIKLVNDVEIILSKSRVHCSFKGITLERGNIEVIVNKKGTEFSTVTPTAVLGVRGTRFSVAYLDDDITRVAVTEGIVHVTTVSGLEQDVYPNQKLTVDQSGKFGKSGFVGNPNDASSSQKDPASTSQVTPNEYIFGK